MVGRGIFYSGDQAVRLIIFMFQQCQGLFLKSIDIKF